jgi:SOS response regulatory protein OraA/RecX
MLKLKFISQKDVEKKRKEVNEKIIGGFMKQCRNFRCVKATELISRRIKVTQLLIGWKEENRVVHDSLSKNLPEPQCGMI